MYCLPIDDLCAIKSDFAEMVIEQRVSETPVTSVQFQAGGKSFAFISNPYNGKIVLFVRDKIGEYMSHDGEYFQFTHPIH